MLLNLVKIFYVLLCCDISFGTERGKTCDGGVCELVKQCHTALQNIKKGIYPKICGFEGSNSDAIVCCPDLQHRLPAPLPDDSEENKNVEGIRFHHNKPKTTISKTKCSEYAIKTCDGSLAPSGDEADINYHPKKFPHVALIGYGQEPAEINWKCGGSLISEFYILTAARCEFTEFGYAQWARFGMSFNDPRDYEIIHRIIHPHYHHPYTHDDIALFKLSGKVSFDGHVHPICLHNQEYSEPNHYFSAGFAKEKCIDSECRFQEFGEFKTETILATESKIEEHQKCVNLFHNYEELGESTDEDFLCVHLTDLQISKCQGMHGDTLLYKIETGCPSFYNLAGILSVVGHWPNEYECHFLNTTMIYTKISQYLPWIEQIVWKYG